MDGHETGFVTGEFMGIWVRGGDGRLSARESGGTVSYLGGVLGTVREPGICRGDNYG